MINLNHTPRHLLSLLFLFSLVFSTLQVDAQGWVKEHKFPYFGSVWQAAWGNAIKQTPDLGYIVAGHYDNSISIQRAMLVKLDVYGDTVWSNYYPISVMFSDVVNTSDGGYLAICRDTFSASPTQMTLVKTDAIGVEQWVKKYGTAQPTSGTRLVRTTDGGYIAAGATDHPTTSRKQFFTVKLDVNGDSTWGKVYGDSTHNNLIAEVQQTTDGGYVFFGTRGISSGFTFYPFIIKTDSQGDTLWTKVIDGFSGSDISCGIQTSDGGYILAGTINAPLPDVNHVLIVKTDNAGDTLWSSEINLPGCMWCEYAVTSIIEAGNGGYMLTGHDGGAGARPWSFMFMKVDDSGSLDFSTNFGNDTVANWMCTGASAAYDCIQTTDGHFVACGTRVDDGDCESYFNIIKVDSLGNAYSNQISGNIYDDDNTDCIRDPGEVGLSSRIVQAVGSSTFYTVTDANGYYEMTVDTGTFVISYSSISNLWQNSPCSPAVKTVNFPTVYDTTVVDFPEDPIIDCPYMLVDVSTPLVRICSTSVYYINYDNLGTIDADSVYVEVLMDPHYIIDSASIPWELPQVGNLYVFDLGTVPFETGGTFRMYTQLPCDSALLGQTHCVQTHIFPDSLCTPPPPGWDGSELRATAWCQGDSVKLMIENIGDGAMGVPRNYHVTEDNIIGQPQPVQLGIGQFIIETVAANGSTWGIHIPQTPNYPGYYITTASVEGCVTNPTDSFTVGLLISLPEDDLAPFLSIDCHPNVGSYDPNDKRVFPAGTEAAHYINDSISLEYHIRFQNTGTDTAFNVIIRDTLSTWLEPASLVPGASSHSYDFLMHTNNVAEFRFSNILLPDSGVNEPASHGFIKFRIDQKPGNTPGTLIENRADIYFDYNAPVITNTAFNTIGNSSMIFAVEESMTEAVTINVYPNPFQTEATIEVAGFEGNSLLLEVFDLNGRLIRNEPGNASNKIYFQRNRLRSGTYLLRLSSNGKLIGTGKLVAE